MRLIILSILLLVSSLIQTNIVGYIRIFGVEPNLFVVVITGFALLNGAFEGAVIGFAAGLIQDAVIGNSMGGFALLGMYTGMTIGILNRRFVKDSLIIAIPFVFFTTIIYELVFYFFSLYLKGNDEIWFAFKNIIIPEAFYNSVITLIIFPLIVWVNVWLNERKRDMRKY